MLPFVGFTFASMLAMIALNTFVLTTLDSATRITRFIVEESIGEYIPYFKNKYLSTGFIIVITYFVGITESWQKIWPVFGATNQLIAALALFVISSYLVGIKKPAKYTLYPAIFMALTSAGALIWQCFTYLTQQNPNYFLATVCFILISLAIFIAYEAFSVIFQKKEREILLERWN